MKLLFVHGWGFDRTIWDRLAPLLDRWPHDFSDRGYFGTPLEAGTDEPFVAIAHSHGAMRMAREIPPQCRALIAINGFDRFSADETFPGVSRRVVERMIAQFDRDPRTVLAEFRARCGCTEPFGKIDPLLLQEDLLDLRDGDCRAATSRCEVPILSLQGEADPILPPDMLGAVFPQAAQVRRITHPGGGHLLPIEAPSPCAQAIGAFMDLL